jgi:N-acetylmuramoyl-L-alanine amidase
MDKDWMKPTHIIIHHSLTRDSGTVSWGAIRKYHVETKGWNAIGYQLGLEMIGDHYEILMGRMLDEVGAHTIGMNTKSIGICVVGNFDEDELPREALEILLELCRSLMDIFEIPVEHVKRHSDYADKSCPGTRFPWERFIGALR